MFNVKNYHRRSLLSRKMTAKPFADDTVSKTLEEINRACLRVINKLLTFALLKLARRRREADAEHWKGRGPGKADANLFVSAFLAPAAPWAIWLSLWTLWALATLRERV